MTLDQQIELFDKNIKEGYIVDENNDLRLSEEKLAANAETKYILKYSELICKSHKALGIIN